MSSKSARPPLTISAIQELISLDLERVDAPTKARLLKEMEPLIEERMVEMNALKTGVFTLQKCKKITDIVMELCDAAQILLVTKPLWWDHK
jgi:hypothetical protein